MSLLIGNRYDMLSLVKINMQTVSISQAKVEFEKIVEKVIRGEKVIITKYGKPKVELVPYK